MRRALLIVACGAAALWLGASSPAGAWSFPSSDDDSQSEVAKRKKHRDGGHGEESEEDVRRALP